MFLRKHESVKEKEKVLIGVIPKNLNKLDNVWAFAGKLSDKIVKFFSNVFKDLSESLKKSIANYQKSLKENALKREKENTPKNPVASMIKEQKFIQQIANNPKDIEAYLELGILYKDRDSDQDAKACFVQALRIEPGNEKARKELENLKA